MATSKQDGGWVGGQVGGQAASHPFEDAGRRVDIQWFPPIPGQIMAVENCRVHDVTERGIEFSDNRGNYYHIQNFPFIVISFDPAFDPDTQGKLIRGTV